MSTPSPISESEILAALGQFGKAVTDYVLSPDGDLPLTGNVVDGWAALLIEDDRLAEACCRYLRNHGARQITLDELRQTKASVKRKEGSH
jgi:hypothetical protein